MDLFRPPHDSTDPVIVLHETRTQRALRVPHARDCVHRAVQEFAQLCRRLHQRDREYVESTNHHRDKADLRIVRQRFGNLPALRTACASSPISSVSQATVLGTPRA